MKIYDAVRNGLTSFEDYVPYQIPNAIRDELPECLKKMGYKVGAEIGVYKGLYTRFFLKQGLKMYAVDPWEPYPDYEGSEANNIERMKVVYNKTHRNVKEFGDQCVIIKKYSDEALKDFADESLDFVYIDANHGFKYVASDLVEWSKKVRKGGVVAGHDYFYRKLLPNQEACQVGYVLDAYVKAFDIKNWYVIGRKESGKCDRHRSWFWIK